MFFEQISENKMLKTIMALKPKRSQDIRETSMFLVQKVANQITKPLCHIYNLSVACGIFPDSIKCSKIIPIFKNGSKQDPNNYRGIALVSAFSKVMEKLASDRLVNFLAETRFFLHAPVWFLEGTQYLPGSSAACQYSL